MTAKDWLGNHIIDRTTGNRLGQVIRLMAAPDHKTAVCLVTLNAGVTYDAVTVAIEEAAAYLAELVGESVTEEVINRVFHSFCVGK